MPVLCCIGSHSTFRDLESIFPALERLARTMTFRLLIVGSGRDQVDLPEVDVSCRPWQLQREVEDFQEIDRGLYPNVAEPWALGTSGFKAIPYLTTGVPYVVSPVGACVAIGEAGTTHWTASTHDEWHDALASLLGDISLRRSMGNAGRSHAMEPYSLQCHADQLASVMRTTAMN